MSQSILLIPVPLAEPVVGKWRYKYDQSSHHGIPAHVTLLFPFKDSSLIDNRIIEKLENIFSTIKKFSFSLYKVNTFPDVIYLEPKPREKFIELTQEIVKIFPECPPYGGKFPKINPHSTIGHEFDKSLDFNKVKEEIFLDIKDKLPINTTAKEVWLMKKQYGHWSLKVKFTLL